VPGRDDFPRSGYSNGNPHELPVDLAAVQADDALLDLIGRPGYRPSDAQDELTRVLAGWREEIDAEPFRELVDTDTALAAIHAARRRVRRRNPVFGSIAAAAAVLVIALSAVGLVAKSAQPGDHLWGVTQVLYGNYARSVETAAAVRTELNEARTALKQGDPERARASLQRVQNQLPAISESEGRTDLTARHRQLEQMLNGSPADGSTAPPAVPGVPSAGVASSKPGTSTPSAPTSASPSQDSATTPDPTTAPSDSMRPPGITNDQPSRHYPPPSYPPPSYPVPSDAPPSTGTTTGDHTGGNAGTVGRDFSGPGNGTARRRGGSPDVGGPPPASRVNPASPPRDHLHGSVPGGGAAQGCNPTGSRPYCH
jgi:hypothetical protein